MKKYMPIGVDDFEKLVNGNFYFVDKTRFIKELIDHHREVTLITRPRRFGKTLNLSMLKYFFTFENAEENRKLFEGLTIGQAGEKYMREQGTRPVVFISLKDVGSPDFSDFLTAISTMLSQFYAKYEYLSDSPFLHKADKAYFNGIVDEQFTTSKLRFALQYLLKFLYEHHKQKPILLIDEYDSPIISAWEYHYYDRCIQFMKVFFGAALKSNEYLDFAVVTGITRVSKESIFSGLNNIRVCSVLSDLYADIFGFTADEAEKLMQDSGVADKMGELKQWYDGYIFGGTEISNPWSVINFVDHGCKFQPYWINVSGNAILKDLLQNVDCERQTELTDLLNGNLVKAPIIENIVYSDLHTNRDALYTMLMYTGYLKAIQQEEFEDIPLAALQIPNREIKLAYKQEILQYVGGKNGIMPLYDMVSAMTKGDGAQFAQHLSKVMLCYVSFHDAAQSESFYHGFLLGLLVLFSKTHRIESNRESGYGRFDIALFPRDKASAGVILELKAAKSDAEMAELAQSAVKQINDKAYAAELERQGATKIWKYGISFHGKKVHIERG